VTRLIRDGARLPSGLFELEARVVRVGAGALA
jgi:hypothetical protein